MEQLHILGTQGSEEAFKKAQEVLDERIGQVKIWEKSHPSTIRVEDLGDGLDPEFDREALQAMKKRLANAR